MPDYTLRSVKGSELTFNELDNNFIASRTTARANCNALITPPSGSFVNQSRRGTVLPNQAGGATDRIELTPFILSYDLTIDQVGVNQTSSGSINLRILIYSSNSSGQPNEKLYESATIATASGDNTEAATFTFTANTLYWVGAHTSAQGNFRCIESSDLMPLGFTALNSGAVMSGIRIGATIGSAPSTWSYASSQLFVAEPISIGFRAA